MFHLLMSSFRAHVRNGRIVLDVPTDLPDGTTLDLVTADSWDDLDADGRRALHDALARSAAEAAAGLTIPAADVLNKLRARG